MLDHTVEFYQKELESMGKTQVIQDIRYYQDHGVLTTKAENFLKGHITQRRYTGFLIVMSPFYTIDQRNN
jgi:hypothetical protein